MVGMRPMWVETEAGDVKRKLSERSIAPRPRNLKERFTREEYLLLHTLFDSSCNIMAQEFLSHFKKSPFIFSEFWSSTLGGRTLSYDAVQAHEHVTKKGSLEVVYTLMGKGNEKLNVDPGQLISCIDHNISYEDITTLLSHNLSVISSLGIAMSTNAKNHRISQYLRQRFWRQFESSSYVDSEVHNLRVILEDEMGRSVLQTPGKFIANCATDMSSNIYLRYNQVFDSPWACNSELEDRHKYITDKIHNWINDNAKESTEEEVIIIDMLLKFMLTFSTDFVDGIKEPALIQRQQQAFCHLMYKFLKARHGAAKAWVKFGGAVMISSYARELRDIETKRLKM